MAEAAGEAAAAKAYLDGLGSEIVHAAGRKRAAPKVLFTEYTASVAELQEDTGERAKVNSALIELAQKLARPTRLA